MRTLLIRSASGIVFVALMVSAILWNQYSFAIIMSLILAGSINEYFNITTPKREKGKARLQVKWLVLALSLLLYWTSFLFLLYGLANLRLLMTALVSILVFIIFIYELFAETENSFSNIGWNVIAVFWFVVPIILTNKLYFEKGGAFVVAIFVLIWLYDSACYASGNLFGKHPLFKRISPKKTIEGSIGGIVVTLALAYFFNLCPLLSSLSKPDWMVLALVIIVSATFGDLVESLLKRNLNIKDSGSIMPGHGGFLDRFDAYFLTPPFVLATLWIINQLHSINVAF